MISLGEVAKASSIACWQTSGREAVIKVMGRDAAERMRLGPDPARVSVKGYVGQAKFLFGLSGSQIEAALGLPPRSLSEGAYIYRLARLPTWTEIDFKGSLAWPDGRVPTAEEYDALIDRRNSALLGLTSDPALYPPGGAHIPQWRLSFPSSHPGIEGHLLQIVRGTETFYRDQPFRPHGRDVNWGAIL